MGRVLESTPPLGAEDGAGARAGDKGCMASSTPPPFNKISHPVRGGEKEHFDNGAGSGRHGV